jgi:phospholipid/cholesterol/gamma-HCH transport system substrate-binding protein
MADDKTTTTNATTDIANTPDRPKMKTRRVNVGGKSFSSRNPTSIGAIGLVVILALLWAAFNAESLPLIGGGTTYTAYFKDDAALREGDEVRIAGVKVGKVDAISLVDSPSGDKVKVEFKVKNAFIGDQSTIDIKIKTLLGAKYLSINSQGGDAQDSGTAIDVDRTTSPYDIYPAFTKLTDTIDAIDTDSLAKSLSTLSSAFSDTPKSVRSALDGLTRLSTTISSRDAELRELLARANQVTGVIASRDDQLAKLFKDGGLLLDELNARRDAIHSLLVNTTTLSVQLQGLVSDNQKTIGPLLDQLHRILTLLQSNQDNLDRGLALLAPFYRVFNNTIGNGRWFDNYICNLSVPGVLGILNLQNDTGKCS